MRHHGWTPTFGDDGGSWLGMGLLMILIWAMFLGLVVWGVYAVRSAVEPDAHEPPEPLEPAAPPPDPAAEHLAARYAAGEIDAEEFEERYARLRKARQDHC